MAFRKALIALASLLALAAPGSAQTSAEVAAYAGPDRTERLVAGAKREGTLTLYTSAAVADMALVIAAFEKTYGVGTKVWRASSEAIVQRSGTEARGGRVEGGGLQAGGGGAA